MSDDQDDQQTADDQSTAKAAKSDQQASQDRSDHSGTALMIELAETDKRFEGSIIRLTIQRNLSTTNLQERLTDG
jgi:hypothetical protein